MSAIRTNGVEDTGALNSTYVQPRHMDVMLGRGKSYRKNPGNMAFQGNTNPHQTCILHLL